MSPITSPTPASPNSRLPGETDEQMHARIAARDKAAAEQRERAQANADARRAGAQAAIDAAQADMARLRRALRDFDANPERQRLVAEFRAAAERLRQAEAVRR